MARFDLDVLSSRPASEVFASLTDLDRQPERQRGVLTSRHVPTGPPAVGTRVENVRQTPLGRVRFTDALTAWDPAARTWTERGGAGMVRGSGSRWSIQPDGPGTRVHVEVWMRAASLWRLFEPVIARTARRDMRSDLQPLKTSLSGISTDSNAKPPATFACRTRSSAASAWRIRSSGPRDELGLHPICSATVAA